MSSADLLAAVYSRERTLLDPLFLTPERLFYKIMRVDPQRARTLINRQRGPGGRPPTVNRADETAASR